MKAKLIACMLGMSIVFTTGTVIPAETDEASAGFVVENTAAEQPAEPPAPAPEPVPEPAPDTGTENTGAPESGSQGSAADTGDSQNQGQNEAGNTSSGDPADSGSAGTGGASSSNENGSADDSAPTDPSGASSVVPGSETETDSSSGGTKESSLTDETTESVSSSSLESGSEEEKEEDDEEKKELIVVAFKGIARIVLKEKKPLNEVIGMLPTVVEAVLSDGTTLHVPVDWACTSDYGDEKAEKFVFASSLKKNADGTVYDIGHPVAPGVRLPAVEVVIGEEKEETKNDRKEPTDNKVEDAPLVMDDVTAANISAAEGEEEIFEYLIRELKLNKAAACGVLANIHYESGFNPHAVGDGGTSYGICQWHLGRYFSLVDYCGRIHLPYGSVEGQMKYLEYELAGGYAGVLDYLRQVPETEIGAYEAGYYWCYHYESPAQILRQSTLRGNAAKNSYWPRYKDYDTNDSEKEKKDHKKLLLKEMQVFEGKEEAATADTADAKQSVAPLNREAAPVSENPKAEPKQEEEDTQKAKDPQEEAEKILKEEERVRLKKEEALEKRNMADAEAAESVVQEAVATDVQEEAESVPDDTDQEERIWEVLEPIEVESRYFLPTRREDSQDKGILLLDY